MSGSRWLASLCLVLTAATASAGWNEGVAAFNSGQYEVAVQQFSEMLKRSPNSHEVLYMLGRSHEALNNYTAAVETLKKAVELKPTDCTYNLALGHALLSNDQPGDAFGVLHGLDPAQMDPALRQSHAVLLARSALDADVNRPQDAVPVLEAAVAESGNNAALVRVLATAYQKVGRTTDAAKTFARSFELNPKDLESGRYAVEAALAAADKAASAGERKELLALAESTANRLVEQSPTAEHLYLLGRSLAEARKIDAAAERLNQAAAAKPEPELAIRIHGLQARIAECRLDLRSAINHYGLAGNPKRANELKTIEATFGDVLTHRQRLADQIAGLAGMLPQLEAIDDKAGQEAIRSKIAGLERELAGVDANLGEVRKALQAGCPGG